MCFYVKHSINFSVRKDLRVEDLENLCIEIRKPKSNPVVIITWYRPPDSPIGISAPFESLIGKLDSENVDYLVMGDVNCDVISERYDNDTLKDIVFCNCFL